MSKYVFVDTGNVSFYDDSLHQTIPTRANPVSDADWQTYLGNQQSYTFDNTGKLIQVPAAQLLAHAQQVQIGQLQQSYQQALDAGFTSSASGTSTVYGYGPADQLKWMKLFISVNSSVATYPVSVIAKNGSVVQLTQAQLQQLIADINAWEWPLENKLHTLLAQVQGATTVSAVQAIVWT